jgi:hypothetical protein
MPHRAGSVIGQTGAGLVGVLLHNKRMQLAALQV